MKIAKKLIVAVLIGTALNTATVTETDAFFYARPVYLCDLDCAMLEITFRLFWEEPVLFTAFGLGIASFVPQSGTKQETEAFVAAGLIALNIAWRWRKEISDAVSQWFSNSSLASESRRLRPGIEQSLEGHASPVVIEQMSAIAEKRLTEGFKNLLQRKVAYQVYLKQQRKEYIDSSVIDDIARQQVHEMTQTIRQLRTAAQEGNAKEVIREYQASEQDFKQKFNTALDQVRQSSGSAEAHDLLAGEQALDSRKATLRELEASEQELQRAELPQAKIEHTLFQ